MNPKSAVALLATLLAALGLLAPTAQPNPLEAARLNNIGCAYMNQQLFEKGLKSFQQAVEADPKMAIARLNEGIAYLNLQKVDEAKAAFDVALKQDPKSAHAWYNLGLLAKNTGDAPAAIDAFKRVIEIDATDADAWYFLGTAYVQAKQFPLAIEAFQHALKINPLHASAEFGLSRAYQQSGDVEHARENLKKFQYITQNKIGAPMSLAYGEQGQYSRALESPQAQLKVPAQIKVRFVDVTKEAGIVSTPSSYAPHGPANLGTGACFFDYDNDGLIDLFLADGGSSGGMALYHNFGKGKFEEVTKSAGLDPNAHATACAPGDYDNDGFVDLAVSANDAVLLFHNEKNGAFKEVREKSGLNPAQLPHALTWVDFDHDGDVDLLLTSFMVSGEASGKRKGDELWRNNGDGTFTDVTDERGFAGQGPHYAAVGSDINNDRAVDLVLTGAASSSLFINPREGKFAASSLFPQDQPELPINGVTMLDFDHDGWMDFAATHWLHGSETGPAVTLWRNRHGKGFDRVSLPDTNLVHAFGVAAFDYDNDGWVDLVAVGETKDAKGEIKLFRNLGPDGFKDVTADVGLDKIPLKDPRAIITGDYDNDGTTDLLITQNHGSAVLLKNEGANQNHWLKVSLKGLNDNKSGIGTKVEVFSGGNRQKFEIYGSNGYLGQNSTDVVVGLGESKNADIVRMLWPTGVLQDEVDENQVAGDKRHEFLEIDRRGSSCPTLFAWNGERYELIGDMLGAGVVGHWIGPGQRDIPRPVEWIKVDRNMIYEKEYSQVSQSRRDMGHPTSVVDTGITGSGSASLLAAGARSGSVPTTNDEQPSTVLSFRFMEPLEEAVYLDQVRLMAVDHPANLDVYPNEYFASNPPYPKFKVVVSRNAKPPAGAWDDHGHDVLPDLLAHRFFGDFAMTQFAGFAKPHSLTLDLGDAYKGGPLWLLMHGEVEYFTANSMYAASQAGLQAFAPYVEVLGADGKWKRVIEDMGFPAGGPRTMTADLSGKLPVGTRKIRLTTNLQIYWDSILIDRTEQPAAASTAEAKGGTSSGQPAGGGRYRLIDLPLIRANLQFRGYPLKIEGTPPGNVKYIYEQASATGPYTRPAGTYTRYGNVLPLLTKNDDKLAVFGSGDEVQLDFNPSSLPKLPKGWVRDYFFAAKGYEKDMDFYAAEGNYVAPLPFLSMGDYPYGPPKSFPLDDAHVNYLLEYNTRHMSGNEQRGYWFDYGKGSKSTQ